MVYSSLRNVVPRCSEIAFTNSVLVPLKHRGTRLNGHRREQFLHDKIHRVTHCQHHGRYISLVDIPNFRNSLSPYSHAGIKPDHLGGDRHHNLDATFVVNFLELFQASAHEVIGVRSTVITLHVCEEPRSTKAIPHRVGHKLAWITSPP